MPKELKILFTVNIPVHGHESIEELLSEIRSVSPIIHEQTLESWRPYIYPDRERSTQIKDEIRRKIKGVEVLCSGFEFDRDVLTAADSLKWVHCYFAGFERLLFPEMVKSDVLLTCSSGMHGTQVGEMAVTLMLAWTRRIPLFTRAQLRSQWLGSLVYVPDEMYGKTVGIVGVGAIGKEIARKVKAFDTHVLGLGHIRKIESPWVDEVLPSGDLAQLLRRSDFVVLACPLTPETKGMLGNKEFKQMKKTGVVVNISRGGLIKHDELANAIKDGVIAGACLDAHNPEPLPPTSPLWRMENVIITPHAGGPTPYYDQRAIAIFRENVKRYLRGEPLVNLIDKEKGVIMPTAPIWPLPLATH
jgi:phosphoglycerate dehydrogenase-like enzyme